MHAMMAEYATTVRMLYRAALVKPVDPDMLTRTEPALVGAGVEYGP